MWHYTLKEIACKLYIWSLSFSENIFSENFFSQKWEILTHNVFFSESVRELKKLQSHHHFKEFMRAHNKDYPNFAEYQKRFVIFKENMQKVQFLRETERGTGIYGATRFADLSAQDFKERHLGFYPNKYNPVDNVFESELPDADIPDVELPIKFDWREQGAVTPVKNQGTDRVNNMNPKYYNHRY